MVFLGRFATRLQQFKKESEKSFYGILGLVTLLLIFAFSKFSDEKKVIFKIKSQPDFKNGQILRKQTSSYYREKVDLYKKKSQKLEKTQGLLAERLKSIEERIQKIVEDTEEKLATKSYLESQSPSRGDIVENHRRIDSQDALSAPYRPFPPGDSSAIQRIARSPRPFRKRPKKKKTTSSSVVSFPVKKMEKKTSAVALPAGAFVKGTMLTGVDAPTGKTYPVLLALDYVFVSPNNYKIDLRGCFMLAKAQGDLSTERVQMQPSKLSCVSSRGEMLEREITGFIADQKDGHFALRGKVKSKRGKALTMTFLSSIVEGIGKAVQQAQTTQTSNAVEGSKSIVTGSQSKFIAAGAGANAAGMITKWYLNQAQSLLPTVSVGSGQPIWIVLTRSVELPKRYFQQKPIKGWRKGRTNAPYKYLSKFIRP